MNLPVIAITMGDPAGIGPEIVAKLFADEKLHKDHRAFVVGDETILRREMRALKLDIAIRRIQSPSDARFDAGTMDLLPVSSLPAHLGYGIVSAEAGRAAYAYVCTAIDLAKDGVVDAICTAPIHKESLHAAGVTQPGHTEILAERTATREFAMVLLAPQLRTILVTVHLALRKAVDSLTIEKELMTIRIAHQTLRSFGIADPRIAVAGLNPHAGEGGLFGDEESRVIAPAIQQARELGVNVSGPYPGDTVFMNARQGMFDIVVAQYHDQGLIPVKLLGLDQGVNLTAGLPFIRTSVDHGTAFEIAGKGIAREGSLRSALDVARDLAQHRVQ